MTTLADRTIAALRSTHDELGALVSGLSDDQLASTSGASRWTVAQVLSHLGSGAQIARASYLSAVNGTPGPGPDFNQEVWDRWDAVGPHDQAAGFVEHDSSLVALLESLPSQQRENLHIELGFLPAPLPLGSVAGMRLNETTLHAWDVHVAVDPAATLAAPSAEVIGAHFTGGLGFLLGFIGKSDELSEPALVEIQDSGLAIAIDDHVSLSAAPAEATATFTGELEAAIRLIGGRLTAPYTPAGVSVTGNITLDDLRRVFPGY